MLRFFRRQPRRAARPEIFQSPEAFCAALRGHSQVHHCFAWGQYFLDIRERVADCVIRAEAYASEDYTAAPLFTMVHTIYEAAPWPLPKPLKDKLENLVESINATRPVQKTAG